MDDVQWTTVATGNENCGFSYMIPPGEYVILVPSADLGMNHVFLPSITFKDSRGGFGTRNARGKLICNKAKTTFQT